MNCNITHQIHYITCSPHLSKPRKMESGKLTELRASRCRLYLRIFCLVDVMALAHLTQRPLQGALFLELRISWRCIWFKKLPDPPVCMQCKGKTPAPGWLQIINSQSPQNELTPNHSSSFWIALELPNRAYLTENIPHFVFLLCYFPGRSVRTSNKKSSPHPSHYSYHPIFLFFFETSAALGKTKKPTSKNFFPPLPLRQCLSLCLSRRFRRCTARVSLFRPSRLSRLRLSRKSRRLSWLRLPLLALRFPRLPRLSLRRLARPRFRIGQELLPPTACRLVAAASPAAPPPQWMALPPAHLRLRAKSLPRSMASSPGRVVSGSMTR